MMQYTNQGREEAEVGFMTAIVGVGLGGEEELGVGMMMYPAAGEHS